MPATTSKPGEGVTALSVFDTAIGRCALSWRGGLVVGAALPEADERTLRLSLARRFPGAVEMIAPPEIENVIRQVAALLSGADADLSSVGVDLRALGAFERSVLEETRRIPRGQTRTYGELAATLGSPGAARAVGRALGANPIPIVIPCHRVLAADGKSGGFSAPGGAATKLKILELEGAVRGEAPMLFERLPWQMKV